MKYGIFQIVNPTSVKHIPSSTVLEKKEENVKKLQELLEKEHIGSIHPSPNNLKPTKACWLRLVIQDTGQDIKTILIPVFKTNLVTKKEVRVYDGPESWLEKPTVYQRADGRLFIIKDGRGRTPDSIQYLFPEETELAE